MAFVKLSALIDDLKKYPTPGLDNVIEDAAYITLAYFPQPAPPALLNVVTMALLIDRLLVHELSPGAMGVVRDVDIRDLPDKPPALMRLPWIIETKDLNDSLFGDTICLGGYFIREKYFLIGFQSGGVIRVEPWEPEWGKDLKVPIEHSPLVDESLVEGRQDWVTQAARFSLGLGLLLEAEKTPLVIKQAGKGRKNKGKKNTKGEDGWATRRVVLGKMATRYYNQSVPSGELNKEGKVLSRAMVTGHLRYQPYGPGRENRKWIWIDTYESRRWTAKKTKVEVVKD